MIFLEVEGGMICLLPKAPQTGLRDKAKIGVALQRLAHLTLSYGRTPLHLQVFKIYKAPFSFGIIETLQNPPLCHPKENWAFSHKPTT